MIITRWWTALLELLDRREAASCLAVFRICMASTVRLELLGIWLSGVHLLMWVDVSDTGYKRIYPPEGLVQWFGGATASVIDAVLSASLLFSVASVLGIGGRFTHFILLQLMLALLPGLNHDTGGSYDLLINNGLWLMVLAPTARTFSVDCYLRTRKWRDDTPVPAWVRYLGIFQVLTMYWTSGLQKISIYWIPGGDFSTLYYILQQPNYQRFDMEWVAWIYPLTQLATATTWFWQLLVPIAVLACWYRLTAQRRVNGEPGLTSTMCAPGLLP